MPRERQPPAGIEVLMVKSALGMDPSNAADPLEARLIDCVVYKEELRREHNRFGALMRAGKITEAAFRAYQDDEFEPRMDAAADEQFALEAAIVESALGPG